MPESYFNDPSKKISEFYQGYDMFKVLYVPNTNYKHIVFAFKSNGVMSEQLFDMIEAGSAKELQEMQTNNAVKAVNEDILRTLVAVKILNDHFKDKKALW